MEPESRVSKTKPAPIQAPPASAVVVESPLSPDGANATGIVLQYPQVTAAAYTIRKGVKHTPLEVTKCVCTFHTPSTPPTHTAFLSIL